MPPKGRLGALITPGAEGLPQGLGVAPGMRVCECECECEFEFEFESESEA